MYTFPKPLRPGATIAIVAPSAALADDDLQEGVDFIRSLGYDVKLGQSVGAHWGYLAGTDELRAQDIHEAFGDDGVSAVLCLRGGYGAARLLPLLDYDFIAAHPKLFMGFSDITALHTAFQQRCRMATVHCAMAMSLGHTASDYMREQFAQGLQSPFSARSLSLPEGTMLEPIVPGCVSGPLCGGNMMLLSVLTGTPYELDGTAAVVLLEEIGEDAYALDRMLCQFEQSGLPERAAAFVFGDFAHCEPTQKSEYEFTVKEVVFQYAQRWGKPALWGFPAGHGRHNAWLPFGSTARLCSTADGAELAITAPTF